MDDTRASNEPVEDQPSGGDQMSADLESRGDEDDAPVGGDETTEEQLEADNPVEEDTLKTLDPGDAPA